MLQKKKGGGINLRQNKREKKEIDGLPVVFFFFLPLRFTYYSCDWWVEEGVCMSLCMLLDAYISSFPLLHGRLEALTDNFPNYAIHVVLITHVNFFEFFFLLLFLSPSFSSSIV